MYMNTGERNSKGRVIYRGRSGGRYVITASGRHQYLPVSASAPAAPTTPPGFVKVTVDGHPWIVDREARIRKPDGSRAQLQPAQVNTILTRVARAHPTHLNARHIPYVTRVTNTHLPVNNIYKATNEYINSLNRPGYAVRVFFHRGTGNLYYRTVNGAFHPAHANTVPHHIRMFPRARNQMRALLAMVQNDFPRNEYGTFLSGGAGSLPRLSGPRSNAELLNNMAHQITARGPINVTRYTQNEKNRLIPKILNRIKVSKNRYKANKAAGVSEAMYGKFANNAKAWFRGYRAVKPLSGSVKSPRIRTETPNRGTPGGKTNTNFVTYNTLETPHIVVKRKGTETFHINPNTLIGFIKAGSGASIADSNLRNWLRQMRRNHPSEPLFQHPASKNKTVRPKNVRFTR